MALNLLRMVVVSAPLLVMHAGAYAADAGNRHSAPAQLHAGQSAGTDRATVLQHHKTYCDHVLGCDRDLESAVKRMMQACEQNVISKVEDERRAVLLARLTQAASDVSGAGAGGDNDTDCATWGEKTGAESGTGSAQPKEIVHEVCNAYRTTAHQEVIAMSLEERLSQFQAFLVPDIGWRAAISDVTSRFALHALSDMHQTMLMTDILMLQNVYRMQELSRMMPQRFSGTLEEKKTRFKQIFERFERSIGCVVEYMSKMYDDDGEYHKTAYGVMDGRMTEQERQAFLIGRLVVRVKASGAAGRGDDRDSECRSVRDVE